MTTDPGQERGAFASEVIALRKRVAELEAGLRPFARMGAVADFYIEECCPSLMWPINTRRIDPDGPPAADVGVREFQRARELLAQGNPS